MESIDKLRDWARRVTESDPDENIVSPEYVAQECGRMALRFADEIEREVADRYIAVPLDMDGVPIHVGDRLEHDGVEIGSVTAVGFNAEPRVWVLPNGKNVSVSFCASDVRRHRQQTVEDVLRDVVTLCANTWKDDKSAFRFYDVDDVMASGNMCDFADEIRKLTEVDE